MNYLWNVTVIKSGEKSILENLQFYAKNIKAAIEQGEKHGTVMKVVWAMMERE